MKQEFIDRIIREGTVDTKKYRYIRKDVTSATTQRLEIQRLPINSLGTTDAVNGWQTVRVIR